jgi:hypothetical protein
MVIIVWRSKGVVAVTNDDVEVSTARSYRTRKGRKKEGIVLRYEETEYRIQ